MVRARVKSNFILKDYAKVKAIKKQSEQKNFFVEGDIIECDEEMAKYLDGDNPLGTSFIKVIEIGISTTKLVINPYEDKLVVDDKQFAVSTDENPLKAENVEKKEKVVKKRKKKLDK